MTEPYESLGDICVIIPTYNEIENIESITSRIRKAVPKAHILIADDNSPDGTGAKADELAAADDHIHVMHRAGKEGLAAAYLAGFGWALNQGYSIIGETDADGSHQPEFLPAILNALVDADMVKGSRWVKGGKVINYPKFREYLSRGGSLYTNLMLGLGVKDPSGGYNFFRAELLRAIIDKVQSKGYLFQTELTILAKENGFTVVEVPIEFPDRELGQSKLSKEIFFESLKETTIRGLKHRGMQAAALGSDAAAFAGVAKAKVMHAVLSRHDDHGCCGIDDDHEHGCCGGDRAEGSCCGRQKADNACERTCGCKDEPKASADPE